MTYRKYITDNNKAFRRCVNILEYLRLKKVIVKSRMKTHISKYFLHK